MTPSRNDAAEITATSSETETCGWPDDLNAERASIPAIPQHDPYTPRKRRDPDYVPYYVVNFEFILRCVIDCTDDKDLFNQEEIGR